LIKLRGTRQMLTLYEGSGASDFELGVQSLSSADWARLRQTISGLLRRRGSGYAADLLDRLPFEVFSGTNTFGDDFHVLHMVAGMDQYLDLANRKDDFDIKSGAKEIAKTAYEIGTYIRFIAVSLNIDEAIPAVAQPSLRTTSEVVNAALTDAEHLIQARGALNALDRVHTALHGYLWAVAGSTNIQAPSDAGLTQLFKLVIVNHPAFSDPAPEKAHIVKVVRAMSTIVDSLNTLRNRTSLAHPNDLLLAQAEAMLVINTVRTLLQYLDAKLR